MITSSPWDTNSQHGVMQAPRQTSFHIGIRHDNQFSMRHKQSVRGNVGSSSNLPFHIGIIHDNQFSIRHKQSKLPSKTHTLLAFYKCYTVMLVAISSSYFNDSALDSIVSRRSQITTIWYFSDHTHAHTQTHARTHRHTTYTHHIHMYIHAGTHAHSHT